MEVGSEEVFFIVLKTTLFILFGNSLSGYFPASYLTIRRDTMSHSRASEAFDPEYWIHSSNLIRY